MGWRWYLYNESLDQYYNTGSSSLFNIEDHLKYVFQKLYWKLDHSIHYLCDNEHQIDETKVVN